MTYSFDPFLERLEKTRYADDPLLQRLLARFAGAAPRDAERALPDWGALCADTFCEPAEESARVENRPYVRHFDPYDRRVDEIRAPGVSYAHT